MSAIVYTIVRNLRGPLSKSFTLQDGKLRKAAAAELSKGFVRRAAANSIEEFAGQVERLKPNEALTYGIFKRCSAPIVTQQALRNGRIPRGAICRDRANFFWPAKRTVFMLDIDRPKDGSLPLTALDFDHMLSEILPWWAKSARMYRPSASAFIYDLEGTELSGPGSLRCYAIADLGVNVPYLGVTLSDALWKAGRGRIEFSATGAQLVRSPVDGAVWQPERLDFAGPSVLGKGLIQKKYPPLIFPGEDIDTEAAIAAGPGKVNFSLWLNSSLEVRKARDATRFESKLRQTAYIGERVKADVAAGRNEEEAWKIWRAAVQGNELSGSFPLYFQDLGEVTVVQVLEDPEKFDGKRLADPHDREYASDGRIAVFYANAKRSQPYIFSHSHGGHKYTLRQMK